MNIKNSLRAERKRAGFTQPELAARASVSRDIVSRIERGTTKPTPAILRLLATALGLEADHFLDPKPDSKPTRRRLMFELECPKDFNPTEAEADFVGRMFRHWARGVIDILTELRNR